MSDDNGVKPKSLAQKILEITAGVKKLKKTGTNRDQGYKYLTIEDAVDSVRLAMIERSLLLLPSNLEALERVADEKGYTSTVTFGWTMEDVETGETRTWKVPGSGWDYHDKCTPKAITASRKAALILIFNLPIGDNPEASGPVTRETAKATAKAIGEQKLAQIAGRTGSSTAIDSMTQVEPERKIVISRPEEHNGHYIIVTGMTAVPQIEKFFDDTNSTRFKTKRDLVPYWRVPAEYEKGLVTLCERLKIEVEG